MGKFKSFNFMLFQCIVVISGEEGFQTEPMYDQIKFHGSSTRSGTVCNGGFSGGTRDVRPLSVQFVSFSCSL